MYFLELKNNWIQKFNDEFDSRLHTAGKRISELEHVLKEKTRTYANSKVRVKAEGKKGCRIKWTGLSYV